MNKWEALKNQLEKMGRGDKVYVGHILMIMNKLEENLDWDLEKDGFISNKELND